MMIAVRLPSTETTTIPENIRAPAPPKSAGPACAAKVSPEVTRSSGTRYYYHQERRAQRLSHLPGRQKDANGDYFSYDQCSRGAQSQLSLEPLSPRLFLRRLDLKQPPFYMYRRLDGRAATTQKRLEQVEPHTGSIRTAWLERESNRELKRTWAA